MCFGNPAPTPGGGGQPVNPAAAPAPPSLPAAQQRVGARRVRENRSRFGRAQGPTTRREEAGLNTGKDEPGLKL